VLAVVTQVHVSAASKHAALACMDTIYTQTDGQIRTMNDTAQHAA